MQARQTTDHSHPSHAAAWARSGTFCSFNLAFSAWPRTAPLLVWPSLRDVFCPCRPVSARRALRRRATRSRPGPSTQARCSARGWGPDVATATLLMLARAAAACAPHLLCCHVRDLSHRALGQPPQPLFLAPSQRPPPMRPSAPFDGRSVMREGLPSRTGAALVTHAGAHDSFAGLYPAISTMQPARAEVRRSPAAPMRHVRCCRAAAPYTSRGLCPCMTLFHEGLTCAFASLCCTFAAAPPTSRSSRDSSCRRAGPPWECRWAGGADRGARVRAFPAAAAMKARLPPVAPPQRHCNSALESSTAAWVHAHLTRARRSAPNPPPPPRLCARAIALARRVPWCAPLCLLVDGASLDTRLATGVSLPSFLSNLLCRWRATGCISSFPRTHRCPPWASRSSPR
jgi:hypothetical protein